MKFIHFSCMKTGCTAEGFFAVGDDCIAHKTPIFCPHCGTPLEWEFCNIEENPIELSELKTINQVYAALGKSIEQFLYSLECPNCTPPKPPFTPQRPQIDWLLPANSNRQPAFICTNCNKVFPIAGLKFKQSKTL